jgi:hypothetical protein
MGKQMERLMEQTKVPNLERTKVADLEPLTGWNWAACWDLCWEARWGLHSEMYWVKGLGLNWALSWDQRLA